MRNEEVLLRVKEQRNILHEISKRKANWIGHILRRNCLLQRVIEGKIKGGIGIRCADHVTPLYPQKLALTSPTGSGRSVGIVRSRTKATEFSLEVTGRRGRRRGKLLDDLKERRGYSHLKEEALDRTVWRTRFGRGFGPVVRETAE